MSILFGMLPNIPFGPFAAVYVGLASPDTNTLVRVTTQRTEGSEFLYDLPLKYYESIGNYMPVGPQTLTFGLTFMYIDEAVVRLSLGNPLTQTVPGTYDIARDAPSMLSKYTILALDEDPGSIDNFLIPICGTVINYRRPKVKVGPSKCRINFGFESVDRTNLPYHQGTWAELSSILGSRSPV